MSRNLTLIDIVRMMLKRWWIILIAFILGASVFFSYSKYLTIPTYTSSGSLYVNNIRDKMSENVNMADMATSQMLVFTYVELLQSKTFMSVVAEKSGLGYEGDQISRMVSMVPKNETEIMEIKAVAHDPSEAQIIVNTILMNASSEIDRIIKSGSVEIIDFGNLPEKPSSPQIPLNTVVGAIFGAAVAMGIILLLELLDNRIKNEDDLTKEYKYPILGNIPNIEL
ncbi:MAG: hypothetical protein IKW59_05525 [Clostridia bacterium]|nr:hypothetical protein [Clostridia bacterium]